jgi:hypothetical protein
VGRLACELNLSIAVWLELKSRVCVKQIAPCFPEQEFRTDFRVKTRSKLRLPQVRKPIRYEALCGTAEAVPSQNIHEITSECLASVPRFGRGEVCTRDGLRHSSKSWLPPQTAKKTEPSGTPGLTGHFYGV